MLRNEGLSSELSTGMAFSTSMSTISLFFTGIIIAQYDSFDPSIRVPLIFLIISTFSFIFAGAVYNNASSEIISGRHSAAEKYLIYAKNLVEVLGLYHFVIATPLVLGAVTNDIFLNLTTIIVAIIGLYLYTQSKFSVMNKELTLRYKRFIGLVISFIALSLYATQIPASEEGNILPYSIIAIQLVLLLAALTARFSLHTRRYKPLKIRRFRSSDATALSELALLQFSRTDPATMTKAQHKKQKEALTPAGISKLAKKTALLSATLDGGLVGMITLDGSTIGNLYVHIDQQQKGIGRSLLEAAETRAEEAGLEYCDITIHPKQSGFFEKNGYAIIKEATSRNKQITMRKEV